MSLWIDLSYYYWLTQTFRMNEFYMVWHKRCCYLKSSDNDSDLRNKIFKFLMFVEEVKIGPLQIALILFSREKIEFAFFMFAFHKNWKIISFSFMISTWAQNVMFFCLAEWQVLNPFTKRCWKLFSDRKLTCCSNINTFSFYAIICMHKSRQHSIHIT